MVHVSIHGKLEIDDEVADMLYEICSYDFTEFFAEKCSTRINKEKHNVIKRKIQVQLCPILQARKLAIEAINKELSKKEIK